jgi:hypothetical protein
MTAVAYYTTSVPFVNRVTISECSPEVVRSVDNYVAHLATGAAQGGGIPRHQIENSVVLGIEVGMIRGIIDM